MAIDWNKLKGYTTPHVVKVITNDNYWGNNTDIDITNFVDGTEEVEVIKTFKSGTTKVKRLVFNKEDGMFGIWNAKKKQFEGNVL